MKKSLTIITRLASILPLLAYAHATLAVPFDPDDSLKKTALPNVNNESATASTVIFQVIQLFLQFVGIIALVLIIWGGFSILISNGEAGKIKKGKDLIFWSIIGSIIVLSSLGILSFLETAL